jgi:phosphoheptose isomerase
VRHRTAIAAVALVCIRAGAGANAQSPSRLGAELQINSYTVNGQTTRSRAVDREANGDFVAVWFSTVQDGADDGVFGQRYASSGARLGAEFQVNTYTLSRQTFPAVGVDGDGDFVVAWTSLGQDGSNYGVFARRFNSSGTPLAAEFQANVFATDIQLQPVVASDADGDFVIVWPSFTQDGSGDGIFARRFASTGVAIGGELQVNTYTAGAQKGPAVDLDADGDFVVAWHSLGQDGDLYGVFAQRFNSLGARRGTEFQVNVYVTSHQSYPSVGLDADSDFVVAWNSYGQDGSKRGIFARRFDSAGAARGAETPINIFTQENQSLSSIGIDADGDFVVAWHSDDQDGNGTGIFARSFRSSGAPTSGDLAVNTWTLNGQTIAAASSDLDGDFVVVWTSDQQDGSGGGIFGQRFDVAALLDIDGDGATTALTDGLLALRFLFGFSGATLTGGAVGGDCTRCNGAQVTPYLQQLTLLQPPAPRGHEFQINTMTSDTQLTGTGSIDVEAGGDFVVVWGSYLQDGSSYGVFGQRYDAAGAKLGVEFQVNTDTIGPQSFPAVATDADGDFVVVWATPGQDGAAVFARRYSSTGVPQATPFQVNVHDTGDQSVPAVARESNGDFVVAWQSNGQDGASNGVFARRFNAAGTALGNELQVNTVTGGNQRAPAIDLDQDGDFVIAWTSDSQDTLGYSVHGQRFDSLGSRRGTEFQVNLYTRYNQWQPVVGVDDDGDFVVAWGSATQDGDSFGVFARRFTSSGLASGTEMQVNSYTAGYQSLASLTVDPDGDFMVAWQSVGQDSEGFGIFARAFQSTGAPAGPDVLVNSTVASNQIAPAIRSGAGAGFVVVWGSYLQDGSLYGVFGQRFDLSVALDIDGDGQLFALTDGLLVLRFLFGLTGSALTSGAVGSGCTRCDSSSIFSYLQSLI